MKLRWLIVCGALTWVVAGALTATAHAAGPESTILFPSGGQRGATVEVTASGKFPNWPVQVWTSRAGLTVTPATDKGKLTIAIAADAVPGVTWVRLYDATGAAHLLPFGVGTLPEVVEAEPNDGPSKAQAVTLPAVANGRLNKGGDVDVYSVTLAKGQTLVASLVCNETLNSPIDSVLQIVGPRGNIVAYNHDEHGLDPQIAFTAPLEGNYGVRVLGFPSTPNSTIGFTGSDRSVYRLTLTSGPVVDATWPLAVTRGRETNVELRGWNLPESLRALSVKSDGEIATLVDPQLANSFSIVAEPHETILEIEPNDPSAPQPIALPITITGRIDDRRDVDSFRFEARKGEPLVFELTSRELGYPLDGVLEVSDATGKQLARVDDNGNVRDCLLAFSPPADGAYTLTVRDLTRQGGPRYFYRLRAAKPQADFEVSADAEAYTVVPGKPTEVTLSITRKADFSEPISIRATGLPESVTAAPVESAPTGDSAKTVKLSLVAKDGAFTGAIHIECQAQGASKLMHLATAAIPDQRGRTNDLWLTVPKAETPPAAAK